MKKRPIIREIDLEEEIQHFIAAYSETMNKNPTIREVAKHFRHTHKMIRTVSQDSEIIKVILGGVDDEGNFQPFRRKGDIELSCTTNRDE